MVLTVSPLSWLLPRAPQPMPRRPQHVESSAATTSFVACVVDLVDLVVQGARQRVAPRVPVDLGRTLALTVGGYAVGSVTGTWPDVPESATPPRYREFGHSWTAFGLLSWETVRLLQSDADPAVKWLGGTAAVDLLDDATEHDRSRLPLV